MDEIFKYEFQNVWMPYGANKGGGEEALFGDKCAE